MDHFCHNHPLVKATRRCHHCKKYICSDCHIAFLDRSFCSRSCLFASLRASYRELRAARRGKKSAGGRRGIGWNTATVCGILLFMLIMAGLVVVSRTVFLEIRRDQIAKTARETMQPVYEGDMRGDILQQPDAMVLANQITLVGEAADSIIISLKVNGKLVAATMPQDGRFEFSDVSLTYGINEIVLLGMDGSGRVKILQKIATTYGSPRFSFLARDVSRGNIDRKEMALTFDGGAGNGATKAILDILRDKELTCTMFLTGGFIKRYPDDVKRIVFDGHEIGNHTWSHPHLTSFAQNQEHSTLPEMTREKLQHELVETAKQFNRMTGQKMMPYWRAPFGEHNQEIRMWAAEIGYRQIGWTFGQGESMDSMDWVADTTSASYKSSDEILRKLLSFGDATTVGANGGIILMHLDTQRQNDPAYRIIPAFVDSMRACGYTFTTISELLRP
ncbi:polysaccharide deacetylase family protein [candidate division KSB1 bacterium]|nr:polysaccharide deacetylase family protein [candidate division KSB1 bacterium]